MTTLVGYGCNDRDSQKHSGIKRSGTTTVAELKVDSSLNGTVIVLGKSGLDPKVNGSALTCQGDSGGAAFINGKLAGVIHGHSWDDEKPDSLLADIRSDFAKLFFAEAATSNSF